MDFADIHSQLSSSNIGGTQEYNYSACHVKVSFTWNFGTVYKNNIYWNFMKLRPLLFAGSKL